MKNLLFACAIAALSPLALFAQENTDKTLVKTIAPGECTEILIDFKHKDIVAEAWEKQELRLVMEIHSNMPEAIMDQLIKAGRYNISTVNENGVLKIQALNLDKAVTIKGIDLQDEIQLHVSTPSNFIRKGNRIYKDMDMIVALIEQGGGRLGKDQAAQMRKIGKPINVEVKVVSNVSAEQFDKMVQAKTNPGLAGSGKVSETTSGQPQLRASGTKPTIKDLQIRKGDILIGGEPIDIE